MSTLEQLVKETIEKYSLLKDTDGLSDIGIGCLEILEDLMERSKPDQSERRQIAIQMMASMITASNGQTLQYLAKRSVQATDEILKALEDESNN